MSLSSTQEISVTLLEMRALVALQVVRPFRSGMLARLQGPTVSFYRYLLETAGRGRMWPERRAMTDEQLADRIGDDRVEVTLLSIGAVPAGFFELDARSPAEVELAAVGLVPEFTGRRLGRYLLAAAVESAWTYGPELVRAETSELDDPRALLLLQWAGFEVVGTEVRTVPG